MVAVIEGKEEAGGARYIEFKVSRSATDPNLILGSWRFGEPNYGIALTSSLKRQLGFYTYESAMSPNFRPSLLVETLPEPSAGLWRRL